MENFDELSLSPSQARALAEMGFVKPTPIQAQAMPILLGEPTDFVGLAATGTGKTAAFGVPLLNRVEPVEPGFQGIVLVPTRELAVQVAQQITRMGTYEGKRAVAVYGGTGYGDQYRALQSGAQILVATPGRLIDYLQRGLFTLEAVRTVVLDEADEMISMGFQEDLETILRFTPTEDRVTWMFSATMSPGLRRVAGKYLNEPRSAEVNRTEKLSETVKQIYFTVRDKNKPKVLCKLLDYDDDFYGLIFCQTKALVMDLTEFLRSRGYRVECLHGDMDQKSRDRAMALLREKKIRVLICTDVAARGLDVKELTHVINYSIPPEIDSYIHRIGRTARSGKSGTAMVLVTPAEMRGIQRIEQATRSKFEVGTFPSLKQISRRKLSRQLTRLQEVKGHDKAQEILDENWTAALEAMSKTEIAGRFLALAFPNLFDPQEVAEEEALPAGLPPSSVRRDSGHRNTRPGRPQRSHAHGKKKPFRPHGGRPRFGGGKPRQGFSPRHDGNY